MFVSVALAFLAASAAQADASAAPSAAPAVPAAKPRRICRSEAVIGSIAPKRVCVTVPQPGAPAAQGSGQVAVPNQQAPAQGSGGSGN